jgi:hypothetical protein
MTEPNTDILKMFLNSLYDLKGVYQRQNSNFVIFKSNSGALLVKIRKKGVNSALFNRLDIDISEKSISSQ